ncbi:MAG TPA: helix-turn-helix domain-containing protein, partial [Pseudonocardia sp.]
MSTPGPAHASANDAASVLRQKKTSQETRHDILVVAGRQFARAGYGAVRLKDIADEVGITAPLVVRYFGSKEALFREVAMDEGGSTIDWADLKGGLDSLGHRLASWLLTYWLDRSNNFPALALVRSSDFEDSKA